MTPKSLSHFALPATAQEARTGEWVGRRAGPARLR